MGQRSWGQSFRSVCALVAIAVVASGAARSIEPQKKSLPSTIRFEDVTRAAGIHFVHNNGAFGRKWLPEAMGAGVAFFDYDNDGWQDILLVNGMDFPGHVRRRTTMALYHNNHDGTFTDVTRKAGLAV